MMRIQPSRRITTAVAVTLFIAVAGGVSVGATDASAGAAGVVERTGTIEGEVTTQDRAARRVVNRYAGSGSAAARALQDVPMVAWLEGPSGPATPARAAEIAQQDTAFVPGVLVVPVGTSVAFPNRDPFFHNVFSFSPAKRFDLGRYPKGESKSVVFDRAGAVKVYCEVHQFMRSAVIAVENPYHAVVDADGRFTISGVPAGRHKLVVWDVERRPQEVAVTVTAGAVTRVQVTMQ
jgi:plastocyanin